jgi:hypothetical protein
MITTKEAMSEVLKDPKTLDEIANTSRSIMQVGEDC